MTGHITHIFIAPSRHAEQIAVDFVQVKIGKGIVGDRFYGLKQKGIYRNLTLIESEVIEEFNRNFGLSIDINTTRRNLVTNGIRLNELVGKTFKIGDISCRGIELCEPCGILARQLQPCSLSKADIIATFTGKGGLRAEVLSDGVVRLGDIIVQLNESTKS
jgi:MOSC domain-containing protein YiiM